MNTSNFASLATPSLNEAAKLRCNNMRKDCWDDWKKL